MDCIDVVRAEITAILTPKIKPDLAVVIMDLWNEEPGGWSLANVRSFLARRGINASEREVCMAMRAQGIGEYRVRVWMKDAPIV
jgi:hypothetical protein